MQTLHLVRPILQTMPTSTIKTLNFNLLVIIHQQMRLLIDSIRKF